MSQKSELFSIPHESGNYILYLPLKRIIFLADKEVAEDIVSHYYSKDWQNISTINNTEVASIYKQILDIPDKSIFPHHSLSTNKKAVIIPTDSCNLNCSYCYAHNIHSANTMSLTQLMEIIDYMFQHSSVPEFTFIGGGEPMLAWDIIKKGIIYAEEKNGGKLVKVGIATNMTLIDDDKLSFFEKHNIRISASYDILPEFQNQGRQFVNGKGSSEIVEKNIKSLITHNIIPRIRTTVSEIAVNHMKMMVEYVHNKYPEIRHIHLEHLSSPNLSKYPEYYTDFIKSYFEARKTAKEYNIKLSNSLITSMTSIRDVFCRGEFCFTPSRNIVSCHRISGDNDALLGLVKYGDTHNGVHIDHSLEKKVQERIYNDKLQECFNCFAKYNCAGGCNYNIHILSSDKFRAYCDFAKEITRQYLYNIIIEQNPHIV